MSTSKHFFANTRLLKRNFAGALVMTVILSATALILGAVGQAEGANPESAVAIFKPAEKMEWAGEADGVRTGRGYGDRETGEYGAFVTFPSKFVSPAHSHTNAYHGVVITGIVINPMATESEADPIELGPGSYWFVPAGESHTTACVSESPCTFYTHSSNFFDFVSNVE